LSVAGRKLDFSKTVFRGDGWKPMGTLPGDFATPTTRLHHSGAAAGVTRLVDVQRYESLPHPAQAPD